MEEMKSLSKEFKKIQTEEDKIDEEEKEEEKEEEEKNENQKKIEKNEKIKSFEDELKKKESGRKYLTGSFQLYGELSEGANKLLSLQSSSLPSSSPSNYNYNREDLSKQEIEKEKKRNEWAYRFPQRTNHYTTKNKQSINCYSPLKLSDPGTSTSTSTSSTSSPSLSSSSSFSSFASTSAIINPRFHRSGATICIPNENENKNKLKEKDKEKDEEELNEQFKLEKEIENELNKSKFEMIEKKKSRDKTQNFRQLK
jgi:hypothetical protein